jgi:uncharacterized protein YbjT (DUF2867 family)
MKKICILGGGGFVGHQLVSRLSGQGHRIVVPTRRRIRIRDLTVLPTVDVVETDIHDMHALETLFAGMDAVINLVGILHGRQKDFIDNHVKLPHKAMAACRTAGVERFLHMGALGADVNSKSFYQHSKGEGERLVLEPGRTDGLKATVFRPSVVFGPGDSFLTLFARLLELSPVMPLAGAASRFQPVYIGDVVNAFAQSIDDPETFGESYNLCGPTVYTLEQLVQMVAETLGLKRTIIPLGRSASYWFAHLMEFKPGPKMMTRDNFYALQTDNVCPQGFPERFGKPTALETVIGYLREARPNRAYDSFRANAHR